MFGVDVVEVDVRELRDGRDVEDSDVLVVFRSSSLEAVVARRGNNIPVSR